MVMAFRWNEKKNRFGVPGMIDCRLATRSREGDACYAQPIRHAQYVGRSRAGFPPR